MTFVPTPARPSARAYAVYPPAPHDVSALSDALSISPVLAQILINRGFRDVESAEAFLLSGYESLLDPELLEGIAEAADIACEAVRQNQRILVHGDYDADGVSGTALLVAFLRDVGAQVEPYIPHRIDEGYGLSAESVKHAKAHDCALMISVDCGSSSPAVVAHARAEGLTVIVTDHHMVTTPPAADAFVNPRAPGSTYPFPHLSGAGVAYKLVQAMSVRLGCGQPEDYLDLAAIGTVGDVVPLIGENRILVREGLAVMERLERPGIAALARVAGLLEPGAGSDGAVLGARAVSFQIAPRINACGRLEHAMQAALLLLETDPQKAEALAIEVDALNRKRRDVETAVREEAEAQVLARGVDGWNVIVEANEKWHQGIVGITANRLLDRFGLPSLVISINDDGTAKGSARAPAHVDLYACLTRCADLFTHYGGHPRAGGFSLPRASIDDLRERMQQIVPEMAGTPEPALRVDLDLPFGQIDMALLDELESLDPVGQGNPSPLFIARGVRIRYPERIKERHWRFLGQHGGASLRCIAFGLAERVAQLQEGEICDLVYELERETYRGESRISVRVREILRDDDRAVASPAQARTSSGVPAPALAPAPGPARAPAPPSAGGASVARSGRIEDARSHPNHGRYLADLISQGQSTIVLCRRDQADFIRRLVAAEAPEPPANLHVIAYGAEPPRVQGAEWVLFTPPPSLDALEAIRSAAPARVHVAFGPDALAREAALVASVTMTRDRLTRVFKLMRGAADADKTIDEAVFADLVEQSGQPDLRVESLRVTARILCEIGVLEALPSARRRYRITGRQADLAASATWPRYEGLTDRFEAVAHLFGRDEAALREGLGSIITRGATARGDAD